LFNGYYFDYQLAALAQNPGFINTTEMNYIAKGGKPPIPA
jgi:hypothetical protein